MLLATPPLSYKPVVLLAALASAVALTAAAFFGHYPPGDVQIARAVQSVDLAGVSHLSDFVYRTGVYPWLQLTWVLAAVVFFLSRHRLMAGFMLLGMLAHNFAFIIKIIVERPRPSPLLVDVVHRSDGFSFPSGHVVGAVLLWGLMFFAATETIEARAARLTLQGVSAAMIVLMGFQRVYAGAHWPSDVLGAYLWGGLLLFGLVSLFNFCRGGFARSPERAAALAFEPSSG